MSTFDDPEVRGLLEPANYATMSTLNPDGSIHSAVVWKSLEDGVLAVNGAQGCVWSNNLERDPHVTLCVYPGENPYEYVEIRGTTRAAREDADEHINRLAKLYIGQDELPVSLAGRGPPQVRDRTGQGPVPEAGLRRRGCGAVRRRGTS